jgi:hypothetical protein
MGSLARLQEGFLHAIVTGEPETFAGALRSGRVPALTRLSAYARAVETNWREALEGAYPVVARLVGPGFFAEAARRYTGAHPSMSGDLHRHGERFAEFLDGYAHAATLPYLADVARLEWAWHLAYHAADAGPLDLASLATVGPEQQGSIRFRLHPSVRLLRSDHPIASIWEVNQEGRDGSMEAAWEAEHVIVHRDPTMIVLVRRLPAAQWRFLEAVRDGATLEAATAILGDEAEAVLGGLLSTMTTAGVLAGFEV